MKEGTKLKTDPIYFKIMSPLSAEDTELRGSLSLLPLVHEVDSEGKRCLWNF